MSIYNDFDSVDPYDERRIEYEDDACPFCGATDACDCPAEDACEDEGDGEAAVNEDEDGFLQ